jgi:hypothetical protein
MSTTPNSAPEQAFETSSAEELQRAYIWSINSAIQSGGVGLAAELVDGYRRESHALSQNAVRRAA